jgi:UDP-2,3-diacylglucosamine pyrophosphatase LpxH
MSQENKYKAIWISDLHLGTRGAQAELVDQFLKENTCDRLYLVGDIIDGWRLRRRMYWPQSHSNVLRRFLSIAKNGSRVYYIAGNHDEVLRKWLGFNLRFGRIRIVGTQDYVALNGKKYLIIHGDQFDGLMRDNFKWLMHVGDVAYQALIWLNLRFNRLRRWLGMDYWSLSKYLKQNTKKAVHFVDNFEANLADYALRKGYNGVICGHIHTASIKNIDGIEYYNSGDWVESCTAIVENWDGTFELVDWGDRISHDTNHAAQ